MSKYTITIEEYVQSRYAAAHPDMAPALVPAAVTPDYAYGIVEDEIFPDPCPFYTEDADSLAEFFKAWTDTFYFSEIGAESMARFRWELRAWLRNNMEYYTQLYGSRLESLADVAYKRHLEEVTERSGTETTALQHGATVTHRPGETSTNKIVPLGSSTETEISQTQQGGSGTDATTGTDTTVRTPDTKDEHTVDETLQTGDKVKTVEGYRALILDINSEIFAKMRRDGLFFLLW